MANNFFCLAKPGDESPMAHALMQRISLVRAGCNADIEGIVL